MLFYTGFLLTSAVLVLGGHTVESLTQETCVQYAEEGNCDFYRDCLQDRYNCASDEYPLGYGYKYCTKFRAHYNNFDDEGKTWVDGTRKCLLEALIPRYMLQSQKYDCDELKKFAFETHPHCYTSNGFCQIIWSWTNREALWGVFDIVEDFFGEDWYSALKQVCQTLLYCPYDYTMSAAEFVEETWTKLLNTITSAVVRIGRSIPEPQADCVAKALQGNCDFFNCLERRHPCGSKGFATQEGHLLCTRLKEKHGLFKAQDQVWVTSFTTCLTRSMIIKYGDSSTSCSHIGVFGYRALYICLIETGVCDLVQDSQNEFALWHIVDLVGDRLFQLELSTILYRCEKYEGGSRYKLKYSNSLGGYIKQKAPVVDQTSPIDVRCTSQGGKCQDYMVRTCLAGYETEKCGGNSLRRCCLLCDSSCQSYHQTWSAGDSDCSNAGGQCKMDSNFCYGRYRTGLCGGPVGRKCCIPGSSETDESLSCTVRLYTNTSFVGSPIYVDDGFRDSMDRINNAASECNVTVHITSSWRKVGQAITDTVVTPAVRSNHFVGHAIDMNVIRPNGTLCNSGCLKDKRDRHANCFIGKVQAAGLTWGGVWSTPDPVHIDDRLNQNTTLYGTMVDRLQKACQHI